MFSEDFEKAVEKEAAILKSREDAEFHYLDEINQFIQKPFLMSPMTMVGYRRKPDVFIVGTLVRLNLEREKEKHAV